MHTSMLEVRLLSEKQNLVIFPPGLVLLSALVMLFHGQGFHLGGHIGMLTRITLTSAIYQKVNFPYHVILTSALHLSLFTCHYNVQEVLYTV